MDIREVIRIINQMEADGVIGRYAIGGAVGATFYLEPVSTLDVDIFIPVRTDPDNPFICLTPITEYLVAHGCTLQNEYVLISGWPVQFLPPSGPLVEEALAEAVNRRVGEIEARVFSAEHLAAIALQVGRAKDKARLLQFVESGVLDAGHFQSILARHGLMDAWRKFQKQFLDDQA